MGLLRESFRRGGFFRRDGVLMPLGISREISEALWVHMDTLSDGGLKPPPERLHIEQAKPEKKRGKNAA